MKRLIIGITGASGIIYGIRLLEMLQNLSIETHLVLSKAAELTRSVETKLSSQAIKDKACVSYSNDNLAAAIASGSFAVDGMLIAPCSMRTLADIAHGNSANLITRCADVMLKERKKLVLLAREAPLSLIHLTNMLTVTQAGAIVSPPVPAFYAKLESLEDMVDYTLIRALDLLDIVIPSNKRWGGG